MPQIVRIVVAFEIPESTFDRLRDALEDSMFILDYPELYNASITVERGPDTEVLGLGSLSLDGRRLAEWVEARVQDPI
ncbi:hypothetical protein TK90_2667 (plasmid) [Thioalkalivibrio sp. K90mix]|uniref:hypothetical protein n=1 Tax=Thioalkalivibrio sp. (strain K90mix) TaxID=396595 RepID=UPI000195A3B7|nr:hypothetical protein [Thioalkalivibrio sp. K90mix]ADC73154.1 hypothetical protein TK90_2667 [Thioalkalivibrio sp. K90mix]